jgi:hypothetical protein
VNGLEDRLCDAYRAVAATVDPATIPGPPVSTRPRAIPSRRMRFAVPVAAAAAVTLVATVSTLLAGISPAPRSQPRPVRTHAPATASLPPFTLVVLGSSVKVYNTRTGAGLATIVAPRDEPFKLVVPGGAPRTFLAAAGSPGVACYAYFYRFTLSATGHLSSMTLLRSVPGSQPTAIAAAPGGGYAYSTVHCETAPPNGAIGLSGPAGHRTWAYDEADNYTFSLAATADGGTLALSLYAGSGWSDLLLNTHSRAATVDGASRIERNVPFSRTLAISPDGRTLYACALTGATAALASYSTATGAQIRVLHQWPVPSQESSCQISADPAGRFLIAAVTPTLHQPSTLTGFDLRTGAYVPVPVHPSLSYLGSQVAW